MDFTNAVSIRAKDNKKLNFKLVLLKPESPAKY